MESRAGMLAKDRAEWQALVAALDGRPQGGLHADGSPWNARDVYTHLARWMTVSTDALEAYLARRRFQGPGEGTDDEINARWQAEDAGLSLDQARERAEAACQRRLLVIESVPARRWDAAAEALAHADGWQHISAHRRYLAG